MEGLSSRTELNSPVDREAGGQAREAPALIGHHIGRVHELFAAHAVARPDAIAVSGSDETLTYGQLERRANQLAHRLRALGVDRDRPVGLCLERSAALVVGALGILKAGCPYVALDPSYPQERLGFMLRDSGADVLVSSEPVAAE